MTTTHTSKHFEQNIVLLRNEVSRFLERGICIVDHAYHAPSVLTNVNLVYSLCKEIAKARGAPFVSVEWFKPNGNVRGARVKMPLTSRAKPLAGQVMMLGSPKRPDRGGYFDKPIIFEKKTSGLDVYYNGPKGIEALQSWLMQCETDNAMRFALGLPPKVKREPSRE